MILAWDANKYSLQTLRKQSEKFSANQFKQQIVNYIKQIT